MKNFATIILVSLAMLVQAQDFKTLNSVSQRDTLPAEKSIIYGNFIQRLGFSSGGFPQYIHLINLDTKEIVRFRVKSTFRSAKENTFIYFIEPGNYAILDYSWTQSKWYGGTMFSEPIFQNVDASDDFETRIKSSAIDTNKLRKFTFTILKNSVNYVGTWHFDTGLVSFTDDKETLDDTLKKRYKNLDFSTAQLLLPK